MATVTFWFDFLSPYAYLAWLRIRGLCAEAGAELVIRPVLLAALLDHWGHKGPAEIPPKRVHTYKHVVRLAAERGLTLVGPATHPFNPLTALRVALPEVSGADQATAIDALFDAGWRRGADLGDPSHLAAALTEVGLDGPGLVARTRSDAIKAALAANTRAALGAGVFGVPTMTVGDELFWGDDQLPWLRRFLAGDDPLDPVALARHLDRPAAAIRTGAGAAAPRP